METAIYRSAHDIAVGGNRREAEIPRAERRAIVAFLVTFFVLQIYLVFKFNANWDEFNVLAQVYAFNEDQLGRSMQTFHVHLFEWILYLPLSEVSQIVAGRVAMAVAHCVSAACLILVARCVLSDRDSWLILIAYLASGYVLGHAVSFRTDPLATALMMSSLAVMFCASLRWSSALIAAALAAVGLLVTVKSVFFFPAFMAALVFRMPSEEKGPVIRHFAVTGVLVVVLGLLGMWMHSASLQVSSEHQPVADVAMSSLDKTTLSQGWFPRSDFIKVWATRNPLSALFAVTGLAAGIASAVSGRKVGLVCLLLSLPILTFAFYRNAFPYFFPFIMPPVFIGAGIVLQKIRSSPIRAALIVAMGIALLAQFSILAKQGQSAQRSVIAEVHRLFPEPAPYIDRNGMVPSFPKVGFFMSGWGMENATALGQPVLAPLIERDRPVFVIANTPVLESALKSEAGTGHLRLHPKDELKLRQTYMHHWGPIWVAGHKFRADGAAQQFEISVPGTYTLECSKADVVLDGRKVRCGSQVKLPSDRHLLAAPSGLEVSLRWGRNLSVSKNPPPVAPIYYGL